MQHTLIAVFDNRADAERARDALRAAGFSGAEVRQDGVDAAPAAGAAAAAHPGGHRFGAGIRHFFADLFGADDSAASSRYNAAVSRGQHVLTLVAADEHEIERAADIVERHGPVDIDEETGGRFVAGAPVPVATPMAGTAQGTAAGMSQQASGAAGMQGGAAGAQQGQAQQGQSQQREGAILPAIEEAFRTGTRAVRRGGVRIYHRLVDTPAASDGGAPAASGGSVNTPVGNGVAAAGPATAAGSGIGAPGVGDLAQAAAGAGTATGTESYFRLHYISIYAGSGLSYDDYLPAYGYGLGKASEASYRGRAWDDVEADLRRDWEVNHPGSAWEHFKAAVRHGWEKITG